MNVQRLASPALTILLILGGAPALAADAENPNWPCEQAFVSEVSAAVVWDGPSVEGLEGQWESDPEISGLVVRLTARGTDTADDEPLIETFAAAQPPADRDARLTLLFAGVLEGWQEIYGSGGGTALTLHLSDIRHSLAVPTWEALAPTHLWSDEPAGEPWESELT